MKHRGFTLLEIILASTLTAFVALVAVAGFRSIAAVRQTIDQSAEAADALRYVVGYIERDLASVVRGEDVLFEGGAGDSAIGLPITLRMQVFHTDKARPEGIESDRYEVEYSLLHDEGASYFVRRICPVVGVETDPEETDGGILTILSESIVDFQVKYYDGSEWLEDWVQDEELPKLVVVSLIAAQIPGEGQAAEDHQAAAAAGRVVQRTLWMAFPGEPKADQATSEETQSEEMETETETMQTS